MNLWEAFLLGLVQGLTEYLPVSSSGHLEIASHLLGVNGEGNLLFTTTVHAATVLSTLCVLWPFIWKLICNFFHFRWNDDMKYVLKIFVSMIPVLIVGLFFKDWVESFFGNGLLIVGCMLLLTALLLTFSYYAKPRQKEEIGLKDALIIGLAQAVAVMPGLSRSGSTIATGLLLGNKKSQLAQFSFLMVLVPILGEAFLDVVGGDFAASATGVAALAIGFVAALVSGLFACKVMIALVKKAELKWFALYCAVVGLVVVLTQIL